MLVSERLAEGNLSGDFAAVFHVRRDELSAEMQRVIVGVRGFAREAEQIDDSRAREPCIVDEEHRAFHADAGVVTVGSRAHYLDCRIGLVEEVSLTPDLLSLSLLRGVL